MCVGGAEQLRHEAQVRHPVQLVPKVSHIARTPIALHVPMNTKNRAGGSSTPATVDQAATISSSFSGRSGGTSPSPGPSSIMVPAIAIGVISNVRAVCSEIVLSDA